MKEIDMQRFNQEHNYTYGFKCQACSLEFVIYSWDANWHENFTPFCPECNKQEASFLTKKISKKRIFELSYGEIE